MKGNENSWAPSVTQTKSENDDRIFEYMYT